MGVDGRKANAVARRVALEITGRLGRAGGRFSLSSSHLSAAVETAVVNAPAHYQLVETHVEAVDLTCPIVVVVVERVAAGGLLELVERYGLSRRQAEVARLLALGRSNAQIATALTVSVHTARHHTEVVLAKLRVRSRAAVAALVGVVGDAEPSDGGAALGPPVINPIATAFDEPARQRADCR
jgi:DNA-binding CsgD family transcriptional regulator